MVIRHMLSLPAADTGYVGATAADTATMGSSQPTADIGYVGATAADAATMGSSQPTARNITCHSTHEIVAHCLRLPAH